MLVVVGSVEHTQFFYEEGAHRYRKHNQDGKYWDLQRHDVGVWKHVNVVARLLFLNLSILIGKFTRYLDDIRNAKWNSKQDVDPKHNVFPEY